MRRFRRTSRALMAVGVAAGTAYGLDSYSHKIVSRSSRVVVAGSQVIKDYRKNLRGMQRDTPEYKNQLSAFNLRTAQRILHLCLMNGGVYIKFGQTLSTFNHALPKEYTETLAQLQDQANPVPSKEIYRAIENELKRPWNQLFTHIDDKALAAASLAQMHRATDMFGRDVAIKVQYPHLQYQMNMDLLVLKLSMIAGEYLFPDVSIRWIYPEFEKALGSELNFNIEKRNSRRIAKLFEHNPNVHVPVVYDELSSERLLTMEFIDAPKISHVEALRDMGLDTVQVAKLLCEVFSEMIFSYGFVHCDPHPGNLFVRIKPDPDQQQKVPEPQLVLLDHGLYRELDDDFRRSYCTLWRAMLLRDQQLVDECAHTLNVPEFAKFLPLLFTYRPMSTSSRFGRHLSPEEKTKLRKELRDIKFSDITDFLALLPRDMLFIFRTTNMIRALNQDLGGTSRQRFAIMGHHAVKANAFHQHKLPAEQATLGSEVSTTSGWNWDWNANVKYYADEWRLVLNLYVIDWLWSVVEYWYPTQPTKQPRVIG